MSADDSTWGEDKIFEELSPKFGIEHSTSTIRKYMVKRRYSDDRQSWRIFTKNHGRETFACDLLTQHTAFFSVIYVFVVMELGARRIVHRCRNTRDKAGLNKTRNPKHEILNKFKAQSTG